MTDEELKQIMVDEGLTPDEIRETFDEMRQQDAAEVPAEMPEGGEAAEDAAQSVANDSSTPGKGEKLIVEHKPGDEGLALGRASMNPAYRTALPLMQWSTREWREPGWLMRTVRALEAEAAAVQSNDLSRMEAMLTSQAHLLNTAFAYLMDRSRLNLYSNFDAAERLARLAFKAQAQCRASIETLSEMKNPRPVAFVKQANIAAGHQQVNNARPGPSQAFSDQYARARARAGNSTNELLETQHGSRLDTGTSSTPSSAHPKLEPVGTVNGSAVAGRQGTSEPEFVPARSA